MNKSTIIETKIKALIDHETISLEQLSHQIDTEHKYTSLLDEPENLVKYYQCVQKDGKFELFNKKIDGLWANASDGVPLLKQLLTNPYLIVDLRAVQNEDECISHYGVTSTQLRHLAECGFIAFNMFEYESDKRNDFLKYKSSECKAMPDLLDPQVCKCRINSLRKTSFFDRVLQISKYPHSYSEILGEIYKQIKSVMDNLPDSQIKKMISTNTIRPGDLNGTIETVCQHYAYVISSLEALKIKEKDNQADRVENILDSYFKTGFKKEYLEAQILKIRGLKNCIATQYTASMGGIYNMSAGALKAFYSINGYSSKAFDDDYLLQIKEIDGPKKHLLDYIEQLHQENDIQATTFPNRLNKNEFKEYINFIYDMREHTRTLNKKIDSITNSPYLAENPGKIKNAQSYFQMEQEIVKESEKHSKFWNSSAKLIASFTGLLASSLVNDPGWSKVIAISTRHFLTGVFNTFFDTDFYKEFIHEDKRRILANLQEIKKLIR